MEYQAVGTNEDTIAQINERIVLTTAGIAQLKELCDKMEHATKRVVWGICGGLGKKGVADFANDQLNTGVDMTKPQPCTKFVGAQTAKWWRSFRRRQTRLYKRHRSSGILTNIGVAWIQRRWRRQRIDLRWNSRTLSHSVRHGFMRLDMTKRGAASCSGL